MNSLLLPIHLPKEIFRAYDIRGIVDTTLTPEVVCAIGQAIGTEVQARGEQQIIVGRDGRLSSPNLIQALIKGLVASGCDVINIGCVPTPVLYYATHVLPARSGIMLTGSHNSAEYNGLKIVLSGKTLADDDIQRLYQRIVDQDYARGVGKVTSMELLDAYVKRIQDDVVLSRPLKLVVDCGNGVAGLIAPRLFRLLGCEVHELFCEVDGRFPNHHPDPSQPNNLKDLINAVKLQQADIGIAFDGDGDRIGVITDQGEIIWPDRQLMLFAMDVLSRQPNSYVIYDVKCTNQLSEVIRQHQGQPLMWKTGHSLIKAKMAETGAQLAGEMSGHIFFKERWYGFDDALYAASRLLEIVSASQNRVSEIFASLPACVSTPELKLPMPEKDKFNFIEQLINNAYFHAGKIITIDGLRVDFAEGWGLIRASNTTPSLVLRFEAFTMEALQHIQELFRLQLLKLNSALQLPF